MAYGDASAQEANVPARCEKADSARLCKARGVLGSGRSEGGMRRIAIGAFDLSTIDKNDADTEYIYNEVFDAQICHFHEMRLPAYPTIMDVGAISGSTASGRSGDTSLAQSTATRRARGRSTCLEDNLRRLIRPMGCCC